MPTPHESMGDALRPRSVGGRRIAGLAGVVPGLSVRGNNDVVVTGITHDSRQVRAGDLYVARAGERTHGIEHVEAALRAGAVAVLTDPDSASLAVAAGAPSVVVVPHPRAAMGAAAAWTSHDPALGLL